MTTRCTSCNAFYKYNRHRGIKLEDERCECGGAYEQLFPTNTYMQKNKSGEEFELITQPKPHFVPAKAIL